MCQKLLIIIWNKACREKGELGDKNSKKLLYIMDKIELVAKNEKKGENSDSLCGSENRPSRAMAGVMATSIMGATSIHMEKGNGGQNCQEIELQRAF